MADIYDDQVEYFKANPDEIPGSWNGGTCPLFRARRGKGGTGCPAQVAHGTYSVDPQWEGFIRRLGIPGISALDWPFELLEDGYKNLEAEFADFPITTENLHLFAIAQREADRLQLVVF